MSLIEQYYIMELLQTKPNMKPLIIIFIALLGISLAEPLCAKDLYVQGTPLEGDGSENHPFGNIAAATKEACAGDVIYVKPGIYQISEAIKFTNSGTDSNPIILKAFDPANPPVLQSTSKHVMQIYKDDIIVDGFIMDSNWQNSTILQIADCKGVVVRNCEIKNSRRNGIDITRANDVLIEKCEIHHLLAGLFKNPQDAHGIDASGTFNLKITGCNIHHFSGDAFQIDPIRKDWDNVFISNCEFWTGPLDADYAGFFKGESPGENAVDTKVYRGDFPRPKLILKNITAHGFTANSFIDNRAAFNLKNGVDVMVDDCTLYDNEIAFRLRGANSYDSARVFVSDTMAYDNDVVFRAENYLEILKIDNCVFGKNGQWLTKAGGGYDPAGYRAVNNRFVGRVPDDDADAPSNTPISKSDFNKLRVLRRISGGNN